VNASSLGHGRTILMSHSVWLQSLHLQMSQSLKLCRVLYSTGSFPLFRTCRNLSPTLRPRNSPSYMQRNLSTTTKRLAALASSLPTRPTVVLATPSPDYIEKEELDVELLSPEQVKLDITDRAAEASPFHSIAKLY